MAHKKKKQKYFVKRHEIVLSAEEESPTSRPKKLIEISIPLEFPHISDSFTARAFYYGFLSLVYSLVAVFVVSQLGAVSFRHLDLTENPELVRSPLSLEAHTAFLSSLIAKNQLPAAEQELAYLKADPVFRTAPSYSDLNQLERVIENKQEILQSTLDSYTSWNEVIKKRPHYRDGLYVLAQRSYMLFNDEEASAFVERANNLDPQFATGRDVFHQMNP